MASKIIYILIAMVVLNVSTFIFSCDNWDSETGQCAGTLTSSSSDNSTIWSLASKPETISDTGGWFWKIVGSGFGLFAIIGTITAATVIVGSTVFGRDLTPIIYIAIGLALLSSSYPAIKLFTTINSSGLFGNGIGNWIVAILIASTLVITVIFTIIDWARGRD